MANTATLTFGYTGTDFTRKYTFNDLATSDLTAIKAKVLDFNASIAGGLEAAAGLSSFFISDDFDAEQGIGYLTGIVAAQYETSTVTEIPLS